MTMNMITDHLSRSRKDYLSFRIHGGRATGEGDLYSIMSMMVSQDSRSQNGRGCWPDSGRHCWRNVWPDYITCSHAYEIHETTSRLWHLQEFLDYPDHTTTTDSDSTLSQSYALQEYQGHWLHHPKLSLYKSLSFWLCLSWRLWLLGYDNLACLPASKLTTSWHFTKRVSHAYQATGNYYSLERRPSRVRDCQ